MRLLLCPYINITDEKISHLRSLREVQCFCFIRYLFLEYPCKFSLPLFGGPILLFGIGTISKVNQIKIEYILSIEVTVERRLVLTLILIISAQLRIYSVLKLLKIEFGRCCSFEFGSTYIQRKRNPSN